MFWFSAAVLGILTLFAWRMRADAETAGLRKAYFAAAICGALGTLCFVAAALI